MIELDGIIYLQQTPTECAYDCINFINQYCIDKNILNTKGEVIHLDISPTNILYMIVFGISYLICIVQKLIYSVACGLNYSTASERQLMNLATLACTSKKSATKTTITGTVLASLTENCLITTDLTATVNISGTNISFSPAYEVNVPARGSARIILIADRYGSFDIPANTITAFDTDLTSLRSLATEASFAGSPEETTEELRKRLQKRQSVSSSMDRCMEAIEALDGVSQCNIIYNPLNNSSSFIGNTEIPPRKALVLIRGYNDNIAKTYWSYMCAETTQTESSFEQSYTTKAGQVLPVYYNNPETSELYIRIYVTGTYTDEIKNNIADLLLVLLSTWSIGKNISTNDILQKLNAGFPSVDFDFVEVSLDNISFTYLVQPLKSQLLHLLRENISIVEGN